MRHKALRQEALPDSVTVIWQFGPDRFTVRAGGVETDARDLSTALTEARRLADSRPAATAAPHSSRADRGIERLLDRDIDVAFGRVD